jgi:DUF1365 family protein
VSAPTQANAAVATAADGPARPTPTASAIYTGSLRHRRYAEVTREFSHPVNFVYLDLEELPELAGGRLTRPTPGPWRFRRQDFHGPRAVPLDTAVRDTIERQTGDRPAGPVRLLTQLRCFGISFNPISLYYCFDAAGERVESVLAEVTNTPWRERHAYALGPFTGTRVLRSTRAKALHVSPFMPMDQRYEVALTPPAQTLSVHIDLRRDAVSDFDATLALQRHAMSEATLSRLIRADPFGPATTVARIYAQGLKIKRAGVPVQPHPTRGHA